jgi:chromosomal replication initiation ATPase DnaA
MSKKSNNNNNEPKNDDSDLKNHTRLIEDSNRSIDVADFLNISQSAIKKHGLNRVITLLNNLDVQTEIQSLNKEKLVNFICDCVVIEFKSDNVSKKDLFYKTKRGDVTLARKMAIVLIKQFLSELTDTQVGNFFGRTRQIIFNAMEEFKQMNPKNAQHAFFLTKYSIISRKVESFIEQNKK